MKKLYVYCGVVLCLIAACLVFLIIQPKYFPLDTPLDISKELEETVPENPNDTLSHVEEPDDSEKTEPQAYICPEKLAAARAVNPDIYSWIKIPGTEIDYPVVQSPDSDAFYLRRDVYGEYLVSGSIMSEHSYNGTDYKDPVTVLYGHCMESGAMFGNLQSLYSAGNGLEEYKTIEIYTPEEKLEYEVFAAVPYDMRHILYNYDFSNARVFTSFFRSIFSVRSFNANVNFEKGPEYGDRVLILSTCLKGDSTRRYLVMAKLK